MSPAVLTALAASVVAGDFVAPIVGLLVVLAPLAALLIPAPDDAASTVLGALALGVAATAILAGSMLVASNVAVALGVPERQALAGAAVVVSAGMLGRKVAAIPSMAVVLGILALGGLVTAMAIGGGVAPWVAWERVASQPRLVFSTTTEWVRTGRTLSKATTLSFRETQSVTSVSGGIVRVTTPAPGGGTVREWRLGAGDSFTVRAGEQLMTSPGSRLRFEPGKRIPGLAESGMQWAAPRASPWALGLAEALGIAITLGGGAMLLLAGPGAASRVDAMAAPVLLAMFALSAASWGVYAAWLTADLAIGASPLASIVAAPLSPLLSGWLRAASETLIPILFGALLLAAAASWTARLDRLVVGGRSARALPPLVALGAVALAAALAIRDVEAGPVLWFGLGLAASAWAAPALVTWARPGTPGTRHAPDGMAHSSMSPDAHRGTGLGALVGATVFAALSLARALGPPEALIVGSYPALVAAPLAAAAAVVVRRARGRSGTPRRARPSPRGCPEEGTLPQ